MNAELRTLVMARLAESGFPSGTAALFGFPPTTPTLEIATHVGITAVDLGQLLREETAPRDLRRVAARVLVGELNEHLGDAGWASDKSEESVLRVIHVRLGMLDILGDDLKDSIKSVFDRLKALSPTPGWLPTTDDDPYIVKALEQW